MTESNITRYEILAFIKPFVTDKILELGDFKIIPVGDTESLEHWFDIIVNFFDTQTDCDSALIDGIKAALPKSAPKPKAISAIQSSIEVPSGLDVSEQDITDMALSKSRAITNTIELVTNISVDVVNVLVLFGDSIAATYPDTRISPLMIQIDNYKYSINDIPRLHQKSENSDKYRLLCDMYSAGSRANINDLKILQYWSMLESASKLYGVRPGIAITHKDGSYVLDHKANAIETGGHVLANIYQMFTEICGNNIQNTWNDLKILSAMRDAVTHCGAISAYTLLDKPYKRELIELGLKECGRKPYRYDYWVDKIAQLSRFLLVNAAERDAFN